MILATVSGSTTNSGPLKEIAQNKKADSSFASYSFFLNNPRLPIKSFLDSPLSLSLSPPHKKKNGDSHISNISDQCLGEKDQNE